MDILKIWKKNTENRIYWQGAGVMSKTDEKFEFSCQ